MADTARVVDDMIVVRPGPEEAIKSGRTRRFWQHTLRDNIADALSRNGIEHELNVSFGRVFITAPRRLDLPATTRARHRLSGPQAWPPAPWRCCTRGPWRL